MEAARAAGERRDVGGIMAVVSPKYQDPNVPSPAQLRYILSRALRGADPVAVTLSGSVISLQGDAATSTSHLRVVSGSDGQVRYDHDVTLQWRREDAPRWGIVPAKQWRVVSASYGGLFGD
jgi:hypothetical protein